MTNVRTIHVDWYNRRSPSFHGGPQLAYQGDHLSNMVVFDNAPELPNYYLIVKMKTDDTGPVETLPAIMLEGPYWVIPNYYTQICQKITYQVCCKTETGDYEHHSATFEGTILPVIKHNGEPVDQSPMFDPYIDILDKKVSELIVAAGDIQIDSELKSDSGNPVQNRVVKAAIDGLEDDVDAVNGRLTQQAEKISGEAKSLTWSNGQIKADDGTMGTVTSYKHTDMIAVSPGMLYTVTSRASTSFLILAMYENETDTIADTTKSVKGSNTAVGVFETVSGEIPEGINYVRVGCAATDYQSASLVIYQNGSLPDVIARLGNAESDIDGLESDLQETQAETDDIKYAVSHNDLLRAVTWSNGFVKNDGTLKPQTVNTYNYSDLIPVEPGERYKYSLDASSGTFMIAAYESENDASAITAKSVRGTDTTASGAYVVPTGVNYIRVTIRYSSYAGLYFYKRTSLTEMDTRMTAVENTVTGLSADVEELQERQAGFVYNNNIRRACVCFQFDDATTPTNPNAIKALFTERGYHVGWVLPTHDNTDTPISEEVITRHLGYQSDGDEIICHGKNHTIDWTDTTQTDAQIDTYLKESKATLESYGFIINGFVPTMSAMAAKFRYLMRRYYQYGYSVYIGAYNGTQRSFSYPTDGVYNLWRVAMDSTTLENTKAALDAAIEAGGCITFYGHPLYYNKANYKLTTENITGLLDYVKAKEQAGEIVVDVPGKTVRNYFDVRNDDVVQDWIPVSVSDIDLHENMESPMIWAVYYSRKFNLLSLDCRLRPTLNITGDAVLFKLPVKVGLNNIMVTDELGLPIKVVNATVGSEVKLVGESATWARSTMDRLHLICTLSMAAAQMW